MVAEFLGEGVLMYASDYPAFRMPVPELGRQRPGLNEPHTGKAAVRQHHALLPAKLSAAPGMAGQRAATYTHLS